MTTPSPWFQEASRDVGIDFEHVRATDSKFYFPEIMSGGVAWLDYDSDGWLDLYLVQGGVLEAGAENPFGNALYRNIDGQRFEDATQAAGVGDSGYGMGAATGDFDNDGDTDLYVTNVGPNILYQNNGDGTFSDISAAAGVDHAGWGSSAAFADYNGDGRLDLYVVNYINWAPHQEIECFSGGAGRDYCHPDNYRSPATDALFRNAGAGRFIEATDNAGIGQVAANGLGIVAADFNGDTRIDFYIANDGDPNQLWINNGDESFTDRGLIAGAAVNRQGIAEAGMGVVAFDLENDGDQDLFMTHLRDESNTLYRNDNGNFQDVTSTAGLATASLAYTGFGVGVADLNHDGHLDLFVANGRVGRSSNAGAADPFAEPNQVYAGTGGGKFQEVLLTNEASPLTSRGAALGDYDNDGDLDIAVINNQGHFSLLQNIAPKEGAWIGFSLQDSARHFHGAQLSLKTNAGTFYRTVQPTGSYQSSHDVRIHIGLPEGIILKSIDLIWPDGQTQRFTAPEPGAYHLLSASHR